eukprot:PhF_6_TR26181/c0_g1_i2/m.37215
MSLNGSVRQYQPKGYTNMPQEHGIPLLPGNNFHDDPICRANLKKSHTLGMNRSTAQDPPPLAKYEFQHTQPTSTVGSRRSSQIATPPIEAPPVEDIILRFLAYFKEGVPEGVGETVRIRRVAVLYHLQDNTLLVREASQINSGMAQGVLVRRQRVP